jgi:hypothetical protein
MSPFSRTGVVAFFLLAFASIPSSGASLFTNFGAGDSYNTTSSWNIYNNLSVAGSFTVSETTTLSNVRLPLRTTGSPDFNLIVSIVGPGALPTDTILETWTLTSADLLNAPGGRIETLTSVLSPTLIQGQTYWLAVESDTTEAASAYRWYFNSTGQIGLAYRAGTGGTWSDFPTTTTPVFEVNGSNVPEPSAALLLLGGLSAIAFYRRRAL